VLPSKPPTLASWIRLAQQHNYHNLSVYCIKNILANCDLAISTCTFSAADTGSVSGRMLLLIAIWVVTVTVITVIFGRRKYYKGRAQKSILAL